MRISNKIDKQCNKQHIQRAFNLISAVYVALMFSAFLFCFDGSGYQGIMEAKRVAFFAVSGGYCIVVLLAAAESVLLGQQTLRECLKMLCPCSWSQRFFLLYLLFTMVSSACSPYFADTILGNARSEGVVTIAVYVCSYYFLSKFFAYKKWMLWLFAASVTTFCVICIVQLQGFNPFGLYPRPFHYYDKNVSYAGEFIGTIGNADFAAAFLCLAIPTLWHAMVKGRDRRRFLLAIPLLSAVWVLLAIRVLAGILGVTAGIILTFPMLFTKKRSQRVATAAVCIGMVLVLICIYFADISSGLLHELHRVLHGQVEDSAGSGRVYIWKNVLQRIPERLLVGFGPDTMGFADIPPFSRYDSNTGRMIYAYIDAAHNEFLNILYSQGLFALLCYICAAFILVLRGVRKSNQCLLSAAITAAILGYLMQSFFGISQLITAPFFWLFAGILEKSTGEEVRDEEQTNIVSNQFMKKGKKK